MEALIKSQKETIAELETKIQANVEELKKVSSKQEGIDHQQPQILFTQINELFSDSQKVLEETAQELTTTKEKLTSTRIDLATTKQDLHLTKQERDEKGFLVEQHANTEAELHQKATQVGRGWLM